MPLTAINAFIPADLSIEDGGLTNDFLNQIPVATTQANLATIYTSELTTGSVIAMIAPQPNDTETIVWSAYVSAAYAAALAAGIPIVDFTQRWGPYTAANAAGLYTDAHHPSQRGNWDIASAFHHVLRMCGLAA